MSLGAIAADGESRCSPPTADDPTEWPAELRVQEFPIGRRPVGAPARHKKQLNLEVTR